MAISTNKLITVSVRAREIFMVSPHADAGGRSVPTFRRLKR